MKFQNPTQPNQPLVPQKSKKTNQTISKRKSLLQLSPRPQSKPFFQPRKPPHKTILNFRFCSPKEQSNAATLSKTIVPQSQRLTYYTTPDTSRNLFLKLPLMANLMKHHQAFSIQVPQLHIFLITRKNQVTSSKRSWNPNIQILTRRRIHHLHMSQELPHKKTTPFPSLHTPANTNKKTSQEISNIHERISTRTTSPLTISTVPSVGMTWCLRLSTPDKLRSTITRSKSQRMCQPTQDLILRQLPIQQSRAIQPKDATLPNHSIPCRRRRSHSTRQWNDNTNSKSDRNIYLTMPYWDNYIVMYEKILGQETRFNFLPEVNLKQVTPSRQHFGGKLPNSQSQQTQEKQDAEMTRLYQLRERITKMHKEQAVTRTQVTESNIEMIRKAMEVQDLSQTIQDMKSNRMQQLQLIYNTLETQFTNPVTTNMQYLEYFKQQFLNDAYPPHDEPRQIQSNNREECIFNPRPRRHNTFHSGSPQTSIHINPRQNQ